MSADAKLRAEIQAAERRVKVCEARYQGLVRALAAETSVLWYASDSELQREFEAGFDAGGALKRDGLSG